MCSSHKQTSLSIFKLLLLIICHVSGLTYYIQPSQHTNCPRPHHLCTTLPQFVAEQSEHFVDTFNTTLVFLAGNHILDSELKFNHVSSLSITSAASDRKSVTTDVDSFPIPTIACTRPRLLTFRDISNIRINNLFFIGCTGIIFTTISHLTISTCRFQGINDRLHNNASALELTEVATTIISGTSFSNFHPEPEIILEETGGAAIKVKHCGSVHFANSSFVGNTANSYGGALNTVNSSLIIEDTIFINNTADVCGAVGCENSDLQIYGSYFYGNRAKMWGGAVCNVFNYRTTVIDNSMFVLNKADVGCGALIVRFGESVEMHDTLFENNTAPYSGGGLCLEMVNKARLKNTKFIGNSGGNVATAGSILLLNTNVTIDGYLTIQNSSCMKGVLFAGNATIRFAGNVTFSHNVGSLYAYSSKLIFAGNTTFYDNHVLTQLPEGIGGAISSFQSEIISTGQTQFLHNTATCSGGAVFATESKLHLFGHVTIAHNVADYSGGGIYAHSSELNFRDDIHIIGNIATNDKGGGIHAIATTTKITQGSLRIYDNAAVNGGGVCLEQGAKLYIIKTRREIESVDNSNQISQNRDDWIKIVFANNSAQYGGALYVTDNVNSGICGPELHSLSAQVSQSSTISHCFLQETAAYVYDIVPEIKLNLQNIYFANNSASHAGSILYGGLLDRCAVSYFAEVRKIFQGQVGILAISYLTNITNIPVDRVKSEISSNPTQICFCKDGQPNCVFQPSNVFVKKGEIFKVELVAVDQVGNPLPATVKASVGSYEGGLGEGQSLQNSTTLCTELKYNIFSPYDTENLLLHAEGPCKGLGISQRILHVEFLPCNYCPVGFKVPPLSCECKCDPEIFPEYVTNCSLETASVLRKGNAWITYINDTNNEGYLAHPHCPFDYCHPSTKQVYVNLNTHNGSDSLCASNRSGKLCGSCKKDFSVTLGSSQCRPCTNYSLLLLVPFALVGVVLVAFLLICNLTVAVGTINGLIFYANIISANSAVLLPFDKPNMLTIFIAWINLDFGFQVCLFDGMNGYSKTWLQFVFPLYLILLVAMVIIIAEYSRTFANLISNKNPVATLSTLLLLSYTKLLHTIISSLSFTFLVYPDNSTEQVWLVDASVRYFESKHVPLFIAAVLVLIVGICYTFLLLLWQWLLRVPKHKYTMTLFLRNTKLYSFMDSYHAPYNAKYRYWTGLLLLARIILYLSEALNVLGDPSVNLFSIIIVVGTLYFILSSLRDKIYKRFPLNILESLFLFNLITIATGTLYIRYGGGNQEVLAYLSTSLAFLLFIVIITYHTWEFVLPKSQKEKIKRKRLFNTTIKKDNDEIMSPQICTYTVVESPLSENNNTNGCADDTKIFNQEPNSVSTLPLNIRRTSVDQTVHNSELHEKACTPSVVVDGNPAPLSRKTSQNRGMLHASLNLGAVCNGMDNTTMIYSYHAQRHSDPITQGDVNSVAMQRRNSMSCDLDMVGDQRYEELQDFMQTADNLN